jgi:hypothetical protein
MSERPLDSILQRHDILNELLSLNTRQPLQPSTHLSTECKALSDLLDEICIQLNNGNFKEASDILSASFVMQERQDQYREEINAVFFGLDKNMKLKTCITSIMDSILHNNPVLCYGLFVIMKHIFVNGY